MMHIDITLPYVLVGAIIGWALMGFVYWVRLMARGWRETDWRRK